MLGLAADAYVLRSVASVRANDLEQALLLLPFNDALRLLQWVSGWLAQGSQVRGVVGVAQRLVRSTPVALASFFRSGLNGWCDDVDEHLLHSILSCLQAHVAG
jgi:hypothetical protein